MPKKKRKYEARFPPARIKKIMQTDEEIGKVAAAVPILISRALEKFIQQLVEKSSQQTHARRARTMTTAHVKRCIETESQFDFLKDMVANIADISNQEEEDANDSEGSKPKRQRKPRKPNEKKPKQRKEKSSSSSDVSDDEESTPTDNEEEEQPSATESPLKRPRVNTKQPDTSSTVTDWSQKLDPKTIPNMMSLPLTISTTTQDEEEEDYDS